MRAVVLNALGEPEVLKIEERPDPRPGPGEAVVRLRAAALNHRDVWIRRGQYGGIKLPIVLGSDGAGEVIATGDGVDTSWKGRDVIIDPSFNWGPDAAALVSSASHHPRPAGRRHIRGTGPRPGCQSGIPSRSSFHGKKPPRCPSRR